VAEWSCSGLQSRVRRFDSDLSLQSLLRHPGELRKAEWTQIDFKNALWRIPWSRMKMGEQHLIPLSTQAAVLLKDLQTITGGGRYLFPSLRGSDRPMSDNTVNAALRRLGYQAVRVRRAGAGNWMTREKIAVAQS